MKRYVFEITGMTEDNRLTWILSHRSGLVWVGCAVINNESGFDNLKIELKNIQPHNTPIPKKGLSLIRYELNRLIVSGIKTSLKEYHKDPISYIQKCRNAFTCWIKE